MEPNIDAQGTTHGTAQDTAHDTAQDTLEPKPTPLSTESDEQWGVRHVKPTGNSNRTMCNAYDFRCDKVGTRLLRMTDKFGTPGWRCVEHGDYPCSVDGCKDYGVWKFNDQIRCLEHGELCKAPGCTRRTACTITEPDQYGPPGRRCMTHIAAPCSVVGCQSMARSNFKPADELGPEGRRCPKHVPSYKKSVRGRAKKDPNIPVYCAARGCQATVTRSAADVDHGKPGQSLRCEKHRIYLMCEVPGCGNAGHVSRDRPVGVRCRKHKDVNVESLPANDAENNPILAVAVKEEPWLEAGSDEKPSASSRAPVSAQKGVAARPVEAAAAAVLACSAVTAASQVSAEAQLLRHRSSELDRLTVLLRRQIEILCERNAASQANSGNQQETRPPIATPDTAKATVPAKRRRASTNTKEFPAGSRKRTRRTLAPPTASVPAAPESAATTAPTDPAISRCDVPHCLNREYMKASTADLFGQPGARCALHAGPAICAVGDCTALAVTHTQPSSTASFFGPLQQFCPLHGGSPRCSVLSCDAPEWLTMHEADHIGPPGKRCQAHAAHVRCALVDCPNPYVARVVKKDKFGPPGNRCAQHGGPNGACSVVNCDQRSSGSVREHDQVGPPGIRCHRHNKGQGQVCNIPECGSLARCKVLGVDPDVFGAPGYRCARHGGHLCCTVDGCENAAIVESEDGWRCRMHAVARVPPCVDAKADNRKEAESRSVAVKREKADNCIEPEARSVVEKGEKAEIRKEPESRSVAVNGEKANNCKEPESRSAAERSEKADNRGEPEARSVAVNGDKADNCGAPGATSVAKKDDKADICGAPEVRSVVEKDDKADNCGEPEAMSMAKKDDKADSCGAPEETSVAKKDDNGGEPKVRSVAKNGDTTDNCRDPEATSVAKNDDKGDN